MHEAAKLKPVVIDESLIDLESLQLAPRDGLHRRGAQGVQGADAVAAAGGGGAEVRHVPVRAGPDVPGGVADPLGRASRPTSPAWRRSRRTRRQYCPAANEPWEERFPGIFKMTNGTIETGDPDGSGTGRAVE